VAVQGRGRAGRVEYFFGSAERERMGTDPNCANYTGPKGKASPRLDRRLAKYFAKFDESYFDDLD
jgi:hypothetical protein